MSTYGDKHKAVTTSPFKTDAIQHLRDEGRKHSDITKVAFVRENRDMSSTRTYDAVGLATSRPFLVDGLKDSSHMPMVNGELPERVAGADYNVTRAKLKHIADEAKTSSLRIAHEIALGERTTSKAEDAQMAGKVPVSARTEFALGERTAPLPKPVVLADIDAIDQAAEECLGERTPSPPVIALSSPKSSGSADGQDAVDETSSDLAASSIALQYEMTEKEQDSYLSNRRFLVGTEYIHEIIRCGVYNPAEVKNIEIPKFKPSGVATAERIDRLWQQEVPFKPEQKMRPLQIPTVWDRAFAKSMNAVLTAFTKTKLNNSIVGNRSCISIPRIFATLNLAYKQSKMKWVIAADIVNFYGSIRADLALQNLNGMTSYTKDMKLKTLINKIVMSGKDAYLPQGNPLSPLLANLYASAYVDEHARSMGPYLRYVDDMMLLTSSLPDSVKLCKKLSKIGSDASLKLHGEKSFIYDLEKAKAYNLHGNPMKRDLVYLGARITAGGDGLHFHLTDQALLKLFVNLHAVSREVRPFNEGIAEYAEYIIKKYEMKVHGWLYAYAGLIWTEAQEQCFMKLVSLAKLNTEKIQGWKDEAMAHHLASIQNPFSLTYYNDHKSVEVEDVVEDATDDDDDLWDMG